MKIEHEAGFELTRFCATDKTADQLILRNFHEVFSKTTRAKNLVKLHRLDMKKFARVVLGCILEASLLAIGNTTRNIVIPAEWWGKFGEFKPFMETYGGKEFRAVLNSSIALMASNKMGMVSHVIAEAIQPKKNIEKKLRDLIGSKPAYRVEERCEAKIKSLLEDLDADVPKQRYAKAKHVKGL